MAHLIENNEMFSVRQTPWHRQGTVLMDVPSTAEALRAAKLDWDVYKIPLSIRGGQTTWAPMDEVYDTGFFANVRRAEDGGVITLGVCTERYTVVQNYEAFDVFDKVLLPRGYQYETAGAIKSGRKVWILAKSPESDMVAGEDKVDRYVLLMTAHDGSSMVRLMPTSVRVVCNNTLTMALSSLDGFSIRHTGNVIDKLENAGKALTLAEGEFRKAKEIWEQMYSTRLEPMEVIAYWERIIPNLKKRNDSKAWKKAFDFLANAFVYGRGNTGETLWHAYQAVAEWVDYGKNTANTRAVDYAILGEGGKFKNNALVLGKDVIADKLFTTETFIGAN